MRRVGPSSFTEVYFWGCNPSFVLTSEGAVLIDTPQQPADALRWRDQIGLHGQPLRYLVNTEPHGDHISGNSYFPGVEVVAQEGIRSRYDELAASLGSAERRERMMEQDPDSVWLVGHPDFPPNPPTRLFADELTLQLGDHTFHCVHVPGHTAPQTAVYVPQEGVVFTGDNIFFHCKTFIQEGDPWEWLEALERIDRLDFEVLVPGHGETCDRRYLRDQAEILRHWIGTVEGLADRGLTEDEAVEQPLDVVQDIDPYPIGQRLFAMSDRLTTLNVRNIYRKLVARKASGN